MRIDFGRSSGKGASRFPQELQVSSLDTLNSHTGFTLTMRATDGVPAALNANTM